MAAGFGRRYGGLKQIELVGPSGERFLDDSVYGALAAGFAQKATLLARPPVVPPQSPRAASLERSGKGLETIGGGRK